MDLAELNSLLSPELSMESLVFEATLSQRKKQAPTEENKFLEPLETQKLPLNSSGPSSACQASPVPCMLFCPAHSSLKTRWRPECINLLSTEDSLPSCSGEEEGERGISSQSRAYPAFNAFLLLR